MDEWNTGGFVRPGDRRWIEALQSLEHDIYHRPEYVQLAAHEEGGEGVAFWARGGGAVVFIPLIVKRVPRRSARARECFDARSPYGYASPLHQGEEKAVQALFEQFREEAFERCIVSVFLRSHPLLEFAAGAMSAIGEVVLHGETVYVDLTAADAEIWSATRQRERSYIRRLQEKGFVFIADNWEHYEAFQTIYEATMVRKNSDPDYRFSRRYFEEARSRLRDQLHLGTVLAPNGEVASAALFWRWRGFLQYHLGGTAEAFLGAAPSKLLISAARFWGKEKGGSVLHLGGGYQSRRDALFRFKSGFSKLRSSFQSVRIVCDQRTYRELAVEILGTAKPAPNAAFPVYRAPAGIRGRW